MKSEKAAHSIREGRLGLNTPQLAVRFGDLAERHGHGRCSERLHNLRMRRVNFADSIHHSWGRIVDMLRECGYFIGWYRGGLCGSQLRLPATEHAAECRARIRAQELAQYGGSGGGQKRIQHIGLLRAAAICEKLPCHLCKSAGAAASQRFG